MSHDHGHHDDWFRHSSDEAMPQQEHAAHVNTTAIGLTLLAIVFGVLFTVVVLSMYFVQYANTRKSQMNEGTGAAETYLTYRDQSATQLEAFEWVDRTAGTVNVPLESAMEAVIEEYNRPGMRAETPWQGRTGGGRVDETNPHAAPLTDTHATGSQSEEHARTDG